MKNKILSNLQVTILFSIALLAFTSCAPQIQLTSSWTNKQAPVKNDPLIMIMVIGKDLNTRQAVEIDMVNDLKKEGIRAVSSLDYMQPTAKYDSAALVALLTDKKIDMLLTSAVVSVTETDRYVPGTTTQVPVGNYATPYNPYYTNGLYYNNYYNANYYYQTAYETQTTPGYTVTDYTVLIESHLYEVATPQLLWYGQSQSATKDPTTELCQQFSTAVIGDLKKNNLLRK